MHARNSSWLIILTSHIRLMGHSCVVLILVFWTGVLLLRRLPASAPWVLFSSSWIRDNCCGLSVCTFGLGGISGSFVCSFHISLLGEKNSVASCVSDGVCTLGEIACTLGEIA